MNVALPDLTDIAALDTAYAHNTLRPTEVVEEVLRRIAARGDDGVWITLLAPERLRADAADLERRRAEGERLPLYGIPYAVKDNIDVAGVPTTAACAPYAYTPKADAPAVARVRAAGALMVGKTNLDQLATGLVGTRSPYGLPRNLFDEHYIVGGSSSGSAVAVAAGLVSFALGTDTAGSGRVPAAFNNIVGLKPSRGLLSLTGVVPACRSFDCVTVFATTVEDAARVADVMRGFDAEDPFSRREAETFRLAPAARPPRFRFAVPDAASLDFHGDEQASGVFARAVAALEQMGGTSVAIDLGPFLEAGLQLYEGPFVAERLTAGGRVLAEHPEALVPPVRTIMEGARRFDAHAAFEGEHRLRQLRRRTHAALAGVDFLLVPTTPTIFRIDEIAAEPLRRNAILGRYTTFGNLLDLAAVAVPAGFRADGLPAGVSLIGLWGHDARLGAFASALHRATSKTAGATGRPLPALPAPTALRAGWIPLAVVGAHLSGQPLNHQLTELGAAFVRATRSAPRYRLFAVPNTTPPKPGLTRLADAEAGDGSAVELEVWALAPEAFGAFVAKVPPPLCIGSVELDDGSRVSGFLCEAYALRGARDISSFGGWRAYLASMRG
jgi:allophanate hydrolase